MNIEIFKSAFIKASEHIEWYKKHINSLEFAGKEGVNPLIYHKQLVQYYSHLEKYEAHRNYLLHKFGQII